MDTDILIHFNSESQNKSDLTPNIPNDYRKRLSNDYQIDLYIDGQKYSSGQNYKDLMKNTLTNNIILMNIVEEKLTRYPIYRDILIASGHAFLIDTSNEKNNLLGEIWMCARLLLVKGQEKYIATCHSSEHQKDGSSWNAHISLYRNNEWIESPNIIFTNVIDLGKNTKYLDITDPKSWDNISQYGPFESVSFVNCAFFHVYANRVSLKMGGEYTLKNIAPNLGEKGFKKGRNTYEQLTGHSAAILGTYDYLVKGGKMAIVSPYSYLFGQQFPDIATRIIKEIKEIGFVLLEHDKIDNIVWLENSNFFDIVVFVKK